MKLILVLSIVAAFAACSPKADNSPSPKKSFDEEYIERGKAAVIATLKDPSSAQFRNVVLKGGAVCGEVNAKNAFGGYVGFQHFVWSSSVYNVPEVSEQPNFMCK